MRYRIYKNNAIVDTIHDRPSFDNIFLGKTPNKPIGGFLKILGNVNTIKKYEEYHSEQFSENELHGRDLIFICIPAGLFLLMLWL